MFKYIVVSVKRKYFTLAQARIMLPEVRKHLQRVNRLRHHLLLLDSVDISHDDPEQDDRIQRALEKEFHGASFKVYNELEKLDQKGLILRDLEEGLLDFRSVFQGREIYLCWRIGEPTINFWHEADDGVQGRKHIHALQKDKFHDKHAHQEHKDEKKEKKRIPRRLSVKK